MASRLTRAVINPKKVVHTFLYNAFKIGHIDVNPFIILSQSRSGSNLLTSLLNSNPYLDVKGEILSTLNGRNPEKVLNDFFYKKEPLSTIAKGFKLFYYHPTDGDSNKLWDLLAAIENLHVIHLKRTNTLKILTSRKIAARTGQWKSVETQDTDKHKKKIVSFSVDELKEEFELARNRVQKADFYFKDYQLLSVYYENLINHRIKTVGRIFDFLGVDFAEPTTKLKKQNPESLKYLISNFDELRKEFSGTEWSSYFVE